MAQRLAMLLVKVGFGRLYKGKSVPKCVLDGCNNLWPNSGMEESSVIPIHARQRNIPFSMFKNHFMSDMSHGSTLSKMHYKDLDSLNITKRDVTLQVIHY